MAIVVVVVVIVGCVVELVWMVLVSVVDVVLKVLVLLLGVACPAPGVVDCGGEGAYEGAGWVDGVLAVLPFNACFRERKLPDQTSTGK
eukprot:1557812-Amphidinium_carterae.1